MKIKHSLLLILFLLFQFTVYGQEVTVTGTISDSMGPLPGASVVVKGTTTGTQTDFDGNFILDNIPSNSTLVISYLGFTTQEIPVNGQSAINVTLIEDAQALSEVVVVGYGTTRKMDVTGSITRINSEELLKQPALTPTQSLQGKASGVQIIASGAPGSSPIVRIRGTGTVLSGRDPIYVVDGTITDRIDNISSDDIMSMDILKDASSLAIYGTRGANGVIIITTKTGKIGKTKIDFSSYYGFRDVLSKVRMADGVSYSNFSNLAFGYGRFPANPTYNTNWFDEITRTGSVANYNLSISGGNETVKSFFSSNYYDEEGILLGNDYRRVTLRSNTTYTISPKLKFDNNISLSLNRAIPKPQGAFTTAYKQAPIVPVSYTDGAYIGRWGVPFDDTGAQFNNVGNPVAALALNNEKQKNLVLQGNLGVQYAITDYIKADSRFSIESGYGKSYNFTDQLASFLAGDPNRQATDFSAQEPFTTFEVAKNDYYHWVFDAFVTFDKNFDEKHDVKLVVGTTTEEQQSDAIKIRRNNVPDDSDLFSLQNGDVGSEVINNDGTQLSNKGRLRSYFARLNYDYLHKYLLTATIRRDGSSVFANNNEKWGNFPSVGLGWVISNENFLESSKTVNLLKLRGSWGQLGNQNIPLNVVTFDSNLGAVFGPGQVLEPGSTITAIIDPNVSWEVTEEYDLGLEFALLDNRLSGEVDYYDRLNKNAILPISLPDAFGASGVTLTHAGKVRNKGLEIALDWKDKIGEDFTYHIGGNFTSNNNKLEKITNPFAFEQTGGDMGNGQVTKLLREGQPLGSFFILEVLGFDERGDFVYNDINNDGVIDNNDRQFFGSIQPNSYFGVNMGFEYRRWDFNIDGYGTEGSKVYNGKKAQRFGGENVEQRVANNIFSVSNPSSQNPSPKALNDVPLSSTYFLENGDFFRINNIALGYTLPKVISGIEKIRLYAMAQNPLIFKRFTGYTPELPGDGNPLGNSGIELGVYPSVKSYLFGINVNF